MSNFLILVHLEIHLEIKTNKVVRLNFSLKVLI